MIIEYDDPKDNGKGAHEFTVPAGVTELTAIMWGAGGAGGAGKDKSDAGGAGGAGGTYVKHTFYSLNEGDTFVFNVGKGENGKKNEDGKDGGDSWVDYTNINTGTTTRYTAEGGSGGLLAVEGTVAGALGSILNSNGDIIVAGGNGGDGTLFVSGAGGQGGNNGGLGGVAITSGKKEEGNDGLSPGGGGSGGYGKDKKGGAGGNGFIRISYNEDRTSYCQSTANDLYNDYFDNITSVNFSGITNTSDDDSRIGYSDYTDQIAYVTMGQSYDLTVDTNYTDEKNGKNKYVYNTYVWIDWNQDFNFSENEKTYIGGGDDFDTSLIESINVPSTALVGSTRMRVMMIWEDDEDDPIDPCGDDDFEGEVEDYTISVCSGFNLTSTTATTLVNETFRSTVTLEGNLPDGTYTVTYDLTDPDGGVSNETVSMEVSNGDNSGTFTTEQLLVVGENIIEIKEITSGNCSSTIDTNNIATIDVCDVFWLTSTTVIAPTAIGESFEVELIGNLPIDTYTVSYNLLGENAISAQSSTMTVTTEGTGKFTMIDLNDPGSTTIQIYKIEASGGCVSEAGSGTFNDSTRTDNISLFPKIAIIAAGIDLIHDLAHDDVYFDNLTDFGYVQIGTTETHTYTIENQSAIQLDLSGLHISLYDNFGDLTHFEISHHNTSTLGAFESVTFGLSFTPEDLGLNIVRIQIDSSDPDTSNFHFFVHGNGADPAPYCPPNRLSGNNGDPYYISKVEFGANSKENDGSPKGYSNHSAEFSIDAQIDDSLKGTITVVVDEDNVDISRLNFWIDFNQDEVFNQDISELYSITIDPSDYTPTISNGKKYIEVDVVIPIPPDALMGETRMRIAFLEGSGEYNNSCFPNKIDGEVEDYAVNIVTCATNTWTGAVNSDWNIPGNWSCGEVPSNTDNGNVLIPAGLVNYPEILDGENNGYANNLEIEENASFEIEDNYITIHGELILNGELILSGDGQLLQETGSTFDDNSIGKLFKTQEGTKDVYTYNYWTSPVHDSKNGDGNYEYSVTQVLPDVKFIGGYDGKPNNPIEIAEYWLWKFDDKTAGDYSEWQYIGKSGTLLAGEGYTMKGPGSGGIINEQPYVFQGKPNNGTIEVIVNSGNGYLIGNPYASALDADQFILDNLNIIEGDDPAFDGTLYFWEHWGGGSHNLAAYQGGYATYNLSGGLGSGLGSKVDGGGTKTPGRYIPVAQGFFITASEGIPIDSKIQFNNAQRVFRAEDGSSSVFFKGETARKSGVSDTRRKLRIGVEMNKGFKKEILLTEDQRTTNQIDLGFDGKLVDGYSHDIYWALEENKLSIQGVPVFDENSVFNLGIQMESTGSIEIKVNTFENNDQFEKVYLLDKKSNKTSEILSNSVTLELDEGDYKDRFSIVFLPAEKSISGDFGLSEGISSVMNNNLKELQITKLVEAEIKEVALFNLLGQQVQSSTSNLKERYFTIPVNQIQGVYVLRIVTDKGTIGKKIIVE